MVKVFIQTEDAHETKRRFQRRLPNANPPSVRTIRCNHQKYLIHGTSKTRNTRATQAVPTVPEHHKILLLYGGTYREIHLLVQGKNNAPVSQNTFNRITRNDLNFHTYQVHTQQPLEAGDPPKCIAFCQWLFGKPPMFVLHALIGDEAAFSMNGEVNIWNRHKYAPKNQCASVEL